MAISPKRTRLGQDIKRMKKTLSSCAAATFCCFGLAFQARAIVLDFANVPNTVLDFSGGTFAFTSNTSGNQFEITSVTGGPGDSVGLQGYISGGAFTIGTITTSGLEQTAPVTGTDTLHITDGSDISLTGSIQWQSIATVGVAGILNLNGIIDLTGLHYTGSSSDLSALAAAGSATDVVTFEFVPAETLTQLATTGGTSAYSGSIVAPVPEPATLALTGMGLAGLLIFGKKRTK